LLKVVRDTEYAEKGVTYRLKARIAGVPIFSNRFKRYLNRHKILISFGYVGFSAASPRRHSAAVALATMAKEASGFGASATVPLAKRVVNVFLNFLTIARYKENAIYFVHPLVIMGFLSFDTTMTAPEVQET
jgi:uncharacterized membrane protein